MRKSLFPTAGCILIALVCVCLLPSCKVLEEAEQLQPVVTQEPGAPLVFHATLEGTRPADAATKVYTDEALHVLWNQDDYVSIFAKTTRNKKFRFTGLDGANGGDFEDMTTTFGTGSDIEFNYSVYPYDERTAYLFTDQIRTYFPRSQAYRPQSFGPNSNLMVAKSGTTDLSFKNVGGYLCFKLYAAESVSVRSIILQGRGGETLSGPVKISVGDGNIPSMAFDTDTPDELTSEIVLSAGTPVAVGATEETATAFWMVVPPVRFATGFTITVIDDKGVVYKQSTTKDITVQRNTLLTMKAFELVPEASEALDLGLYPLSGTPYVFNRVNDQENIVTVDGQRWVRFLLIPTLTLYELGPLPAGMAVGNTVETTLATYENGALTDGPTPCRVTVQSLDQGVMTLITDDASRFVVRY